MRERGIKVIRGLLWLLLICLGAPMTLRFLGLAFYAVAYGLDGAGFTIFLEAAVELLPLGVYAAATVTTLWRMEGWPLPRWWWIALCAAWVASCAVGLTSAGELTTLPLLTAAMLLGLHGLWNWLARARRIKETEESR